MVAWSPPAEPHRATIARVLAWACLLAFVSMAAARSPRAEMAHESDVLTLDEAAAYLRISAEELSDLAGRHAVPGRRVGEHWRFSRPALDAWLAAPVQAGQIDETPPIEAETLGELRGRGPDPPPADEPGGPPAADGDGDAQAAPEAKKTPTVGYPPQGKTAAEIFLRRHAVLLQRGEMIIEPTAIYSNAQQREFVAIDFEPSDGNDLEIYESTTLVDRIASGQLFLRYGLLDETEVYAGVRYKGFHSTDTADFKSDPDGDVPFSDDRLGKSSATDAVLGVSRTLIHESRLVPDVVLSAEGAIPIAHASPTLGGQLWLLKSFDPLVIYGGADYRYAWGRNFSNMSLLVADQRVRATMGYAFSVNDSITLSSSVSGIWSSESHRVDPSPELEDPNDPDSGYKNPNRTLAARETWSLRFALTSRMRGGVYLEPSVTVGLTGPGNWVAVGLTMPWFVSGLWR